MAKPRKRAAPAKATRKATAPATRATRRATPKRPGTVGKAEGDAPVRAYIAALPAWQRAVAKRLDALLAREVPTLKRAIKWSVPVYGQEGKGWFAYVSPHARHVSFGFYEGARLASPPPEGTGKGIRYVKLASAADVDEARVASWVREAAALPGWGGGSR